jgi:lysyl-tRNA synthetase class 2
MRQGIPACSGVALGLDRLLMLRMGERDIADVIAFPIERA